MSNAGSCGRRGRNSAALLRAVGEDDRTGQAHNGDAMLLMAPKIAEGGFYGGVKESAIAAGRAHNSATYDVPWMMIAVAKLTILGCHAPEETLARFTHG